MWHHRRCRWTSRLCTSINEETLRVELGQAKDGRATTAQSWARWQGPAGGARASRRARTAPRITQSHIPKDKTDPPK